MHPLHWSLCIACHPDKKHKQSLTNTYIVIQTNELSEISTVLVTAEGACGQNKVTVVVSYQRLGSTDGKCFAHWKNLSFLVILRWSLIIEIRLQFALETHCIQCTAHHAYLQSSWMKWSALQCGHFVILEFKVGVSNASVTWRERFVACMNGNCLPKSGEKKDNSRTILRK